MATVFSLHIDFYMIIISPNDLFCHAVTQMVFISFSGSNIADFPVMVPDFFIS